MWKKNKGTTESDKSTVTCDISTTLWDWKHKMWGKKNKGTIEYDKNIVTCDVSISQCEDIFIRELLNKKTTEYDKSIVTYDIGTAQCEDGTIQCEKK